MFATYKEVTDAVTPHKDSISAAKRVCGDQIAHADPASQFRMLAESQGTAAEHSRSPSSRKREERLEGGFGSPNIRHSARHAFGA